MKLEIDNEYFRNLLVDAQKTADQQDPSALGGIFRYPLNLPLNFLSDGDNVEGTPIIYAEFHFLKFGWIFAGVKGL